jgi:HlyD family secretion protein
VKKRYWILAIVVFHIILLGGGYLFFKDKNSTDRYTTEKIERGVIKEEISATGNLEALVTVSVGSQVSGTIKELLADYNSVVKKEQIVATLEPSLFMAQKKQAEANLSSAKANLDNSEVALDEAARNLKRGKELFADNLISDSEMDSLQSAYESAQARVSVAKSDVKQAEASLSLAKVNLGHTIIRSPVEGIVISRNVDAGQTVAASLQAPTLFTIANDLTKMQVHSDIPESDVGKIKEGQDVAFRVDAFPKEMFRGKVTQVRNEGVIVQNVVTYDAVIDVNNEELKLKPGMTAYVSILVERREDVLKIPNQALRFKPSDFEERMGAQAKESQPSQDQMEHTQVKKSQMSGAHGSKDQASKAKASKKDPRKRVMGSKPVIWIKEGNDIKPVEIQIGITNGKFTEMVEGDVNEGAEVVIEEEYDQKNKSGRMPRFRRRF